MADPQNRVAQYDELLRRFASGVRAAQLYAADHPLIGRNVEGLLAILKSLHSLQSSIAVGILGTQLVVSDTPMTKASLGMVELIKRLKDHKIERISFERGITAEEVIDLCRKRKVMSDDQSELMQLSDEKINDIIGHIDVVVSAIKIERRAKAQKK